MGVLLWAGIAHLEQNMELDMKKTIALTVAGVVALAGLAFAAPETKKDTKPSMPAAAPQTVVDIALSNPDFSTLVTALKAADLVDALKGKGPFTVFAPTNAAFAKLPAGTVESLLKPENKAQLQEILKFHVIGAEVMAGDVVKLDGKDSPKTLQGQAFKITVKDGKVSIGNDKATANVVKTDIKASNGVIHVLDTVILPADAKK
jgi:uncharacterized surface protein with fasciclin (FAS1) repeats